MASSISIISSHFNFSKKWQEELVASLDSSRFTYVVCPFDSERMKMIDWFRSRGWTVSNGLGLADAVGCPKHWVDVEDDKPYICPDYEQWNKNKAVNVVLNSPDCIWDGSNDHCYGEGIGCNHLGEMGLDMERWFLGYYNNDKNVVVFVNGLSQHHYVKCKVIISN